MSIKAERAWRMAGMLPMAQREIAATLDLQPGLVERLTSKEMAAVIFVLNAHWHKARAFEAHEIRADGRVYSEDGYRELGPIVPYPAQPVIEPMEAILQRLSGPSA